MRPFKLSTAVTLRIGPCLDSAGAEYTGLVIGDLTLTKAGTSAAMAAAATLTHVANGHYSLVTIAGNTDTLGSLRIDCNKSTYQIPPVEGEVLPATVFDALVTNAAGGANGLLLSLASNQVDVGKITGTSIAGTGTQVPDSFKSFFNVSSATGNVNSLPAASAGGLNGLPLCVDAAGNVGADLKKWLTVAPLALTSQRVEVLVGSMATDTITSGALAASAVTEIHASDADTSGVTTLLSRLSSARAGYLDNLSAGAVALASNLTGDPYAYLTTNMGLLGVNLTAADDAVMARIGTAGAGLTALGDARIANLDAAITSRMATFTLPTNFSSLGINASGHVSRVTLADTATNLTNLPTIPTDWLTGDGLAASAVSEIQSGLSTYAGGDTSGTTTLLSRLSATRAGYLDGLSAGVPTAAQNATAVLASVIETGVSLTQAIRAIAAAAAGKRSNSGTNTEQFDAIGNPGTARIIGNADGVGDGTPTLSL